MNNESLYTTFTGCVSYDGGARNATRMVVSGSVLQHDAKRLSPNHFHFFRHDAVLITKHTTVVSCARVCVCLAPFSTDMPHGPFSGFINIL